MAGDVRGRPHELALNGRGPSRCRPLDDHPALRRDPPPGESTFGEGRPVRASICVLIVSLGLPGCTGYYREPLVDTASGPSHASMMATRRAGPAPFSRADLEDLGGPVIPEATMIAIWWGQPGRFPADAMSGMDTFLTGLNGSRYLAVVDQYVRQPAKTTFLGHIQETSPSPTHSPATEEIVAKVCQVLQEARQVPNPTTLYLVFTD